MSLSHSKIQFCFKTRVGVNTLASITLISSSFITGLIPTQTYFVNSKCDFRTKLNIISRLKISGSS